MQRRRFLKLAAIGTAALAIRPGAGAASTLHGNRLLSCYVAGVQYQNIDLFGLRRGRRVVVRQQRYEDEICYKVSSMDGATIGFVPRTLVSLLEKRRVKSASLSKVNPHAVPWKQIEIAIVLG